MADGPRPVEDGAATGETGAAEILRALAARAGDSIPFGAVVAAAGSRIHGFAIFLFALPETLPLPLPSASSILGIPLILISAHLVAFGESARLPAFVNGLKIPRTVLAALVRYVCPVLDRLERLSRPRGQVIVRRERLIGLVCLYLSVILFLPVPFVNAAPALCLALVALGMIQRDGLIIAAGVAGMVALTAALVWIVMLAGSLF